MLKIFISKEPDFVLKKYVLVTKLIERLQLQGEIGESKIYYLNKIIETKCVFII